MRRARSGQNAIGVRDTPQGFIQGSRLPIAGDGDRSIAHFPETITARRNRGFIRQPTRGDVCVGTWTVVGAHIDVKNVALPLDRALDRERIIWPLTVLHRATATKARRRQRTP